MRIATYMHDRLWEPLGATSHAYWVTDDSGMAMAFGGLNATARDYARLGELYRLHGKWGNRQLVPANWVEASITPDAPHLMPGKRSNSDSDMGYGLQWWVPGGGDSQDFSAIGVYNQFIYVNPREHVVIVKLSANHDYGRVNDDSSWREHDHMAMFRALAAAAR
jgi:CubicO group peptidase (beta-lactamase class C family)